MNEVLIKKLLETSLKQLVSTYLNIIKLLDSNLTATESIKLQESYNILKSKLELSSGKNLDNEIGLTVLQNKETECKMIVQETIKGVFIDNKPRRDGRWQARYLYEGKYYSVYGKSQEEVRQKVLEARKKKPKSKKLLYSEWLDKWYELYKVPNIGIKWAYGMSLYIDKIKNKFKNRTIDSINTEEIQKYLLSITASNTRNKIKTIINESFEKALNLQKIKFNPVKAVEIPNHKAEHYKPIDIPLQDKVYNAIKDPIYKAYFMACCLTGARPNEGLKIAAEDFNKDYNLLTLHGTKTDGSLRTVLYDDSIFDYLPKKEKGLLFKDLSYDKVSTYMKEIYKSLELEYLNLYSLRHTFISSCHHIGIDDKQIQLWAGHTTIEMTLNTYTTLLSKGNSICLDYYRKLKKNYKNLTRKMTRN